MNEIRVCGKCGEEKPLTKEYFFLRDKKNNIFHKQCKVCMQKKQTEYYNKNKELYREYNKRYNEINAERLREQNRQKYENNKEYYSEASKDYREKNRDKLIEYSKKYYEENKEAISEQKKQYYKENRVKFRRWSRKYYENNKEKVILSTKEFGENNKHKVRKYKAKWRENNKDICNIYYLQYKSKKKKLPATLNLEQWENIKSAFYNRCAYCGMTEEEHLKEYNEQLHQEHFIPLSKGGEYTHNNIIPACKMCNSSKSNKNFFEWYPEQEFYNLEKENFILEYLNYKDEGIQQLSIL